MPRIAVVLTVTHAGMSSVMSVAPWPGSAGQQIAPNQPKHFAQRPISAVARPEPRARRSPELRDRVGPILVHAATWLPPSVTTLADRGDRRQRTRRTRGWEGAHSQRKSAVNATHSPAVAAMARASSTKIAARRPIV